jgi:aryl-alcohol dehydrogenase-like predicted oxidoreductase
MGDLIKAGKIKAWGVSNETTFGVCQLCETAKRLGVPLPVSIQVGNAHAGSVPGPSGISD